MMLIFTAEIEDRPICFFSSDDYLEAEDHIESEVFRAELSVLEHDGKRLWDGVSQIHVRQASDDEQATWKESLAQAIKSGQADAGDDDWLVFQVAVSDPMA